LADARHWKSDAIEALCAERIPTLVGPDADRRIVVALAAWAAGVDVMSLADRSSPVLYGDTASRALRYRLAPTRQPHGTHGGPLASMKPRPANGMRR
jgi:hypothetical protein